MTDGDNIVRLVELKDEPAPVITEDDIARCFVDRYGGELRYVSEWGRWLRYDGKCWRQERTLLAFDLARKLCRELAQVNNLKPAEKKRVCSSKTVAAVVQQARADREVAATVEQWDTDPWLLNTPEGVVDLKTGNVRLHWSKDYMTKMTAVGPGGECPLWMSFLDRFTDKDPDLQSYLQRASGYCLTGITSEQVMFFIYGPGRNGKGVFVHTISNVIADYHKAAPMEAFTASKSDRHETELAMLQGARLVTGAETEEGRRWNEPRIKMITGGDEITARYMRQDYFTYVPQFKPLFMGNHRPGLRSVDEAIRSRMNLIECKVTIPEKERDPKLEEKLKAEWSGILKWMIDGCVAWQRTGLMPPAAVIAATTDYLENQDSFGAWIDESCTLEAQEVTEARLLFESWKIWAERTREYVGTYKQFNQKLRDRKFVEGRHPKTTLTAFVGIRLKRVEVAVPKSSSSHEELF
jgi:putative DNA primase/helicase